MYKFTQQQVEKRETNYFNHTSCVWKLTKYEINLQAVRKQMHKFTCTAASGEKSNHSLLITHLVFECQPNMKVTYGLSTSEWTIFSQQQVEKRETNYFNHTSCVWKLTKYEINLQAVRKQMHKFTCTAASGEKSKHSFLITHLVLECLPNMKVTYLLRRSECTSSHSSKWRKE